MTPLNGFFPAYLAGALVGLSVAIWIISSILTLAWKKITKKEVTRNTIIVTTIIAGVIALLVGRWEGSELILLPIATLIIICGRSLKK